MNDKHLEQFIEDIKRHEGYRDVVYLDTEDNPTGGWGHHFRVGSKIPKRVSEIFLEADIAYAVNSFYRIDKKLQDKLDPVRRYVICNMIFNLGLSGVLGFKKMWTAIKKEDFDEAAGQILDSGYARQVGRRAIELHNLMKTGEEMP